MGTHPIFESDFDCLTEMFRQCFLQSHREISKKVAKFKQLKRDQRANFGGIQPLYEPRIFGAERARLREWKRQENRYEIPAYLDRINRPSVDILKDRPDLRPN